MKNIFKAAGVGAALFASLAMTGCGAPANNSSSTATASSSSSAAAVSGEIKVFAAASLRNAGTELSEAFKKSHPNVNITFSYEGSSKLVQKIEQGEEADLLITADQKNMKKATALSELEGATPSVIATNKLVLVTAENNPGKINSLDDLKTTEGTVAICKEDVPCGTLAHKELKDHGIELKSASTEANVGAVTTKVTSGAADAGFIYTTDLAAAKKDGKNLGSIELTDIEKNEYPAALTKHGSSSDAAKEFYKWLESDEAKKILKDYGFEAGK